MADIAPMRPLHYDPALMPLVVAPPYDVIDESMRAVLAAKHEYNVVHIDLPQGEGETKYANAREQFESWQRNSVVVRDNTPAFWRYAQTFVPPGGGDAITRKGFLSLVRAVPFSDRVVLPHERTLKGPKLDRLMLSRATRTTLSPQFMLYSDPERTLESALDSGQPFADFTTDDGIRQQLWRITQPAAIQSIVEFMRERTLLIADGHHRYETSVAISEEFEAAARAQGQETSEQSEHRFTFAFLANGDDPSLVVFPTHRLVHSLQTFDWLGLLRQLEPWFDATSFNGRVSDLQSRLGESGPLAIGAVAKGGQAVLLKLKQGVDVASHPVLGRRPAVLHETSVALLHDIILEGSLKISPEAQALKTNLKYLQEPKTGLLALERDEGQVLFLMNGTPLSVVRKVAEAGEVMPQKSTFFYPKVITGLCFHTLRSDHSISAS
jgi:uncharacterized protein (DUF1015 family)